MIPILIALSVLALAIVLGAVIVKKLIYICQPNEVLVFSGKRRKAGNRVVGYRLVQGGRGMRVPLFEKVDRLDLTNMVIDIKVKGAYSKGGIPLSVEGVANVKIASDEPTIGNALVRFFGKGRPEIMRVAKETLEGNLRGVLATLTPEEVNQDRVKFATNLLHEADGDLKRLGLVLDTLKIQTVSDDVGYLDSLGRKQSADLVMRSRIAEAENEALSAERAAKNFEEQELAKLEAKLELLKADNHRRITNALTFKVARVAEERAAVESLVARAEAELMVQRARVDQVRLQLFADEVRPAEAERATLIAQARGESASIIEDGKANAAALREVGRAWQDAGQDAARVFMAQNLGKLSGQILQTTKGLKVDRISVIDGELSEGRSGAVKATVAAEKIKGALGVDVPKLLESFTS